MILWLSSLLAQLVSFAQAAAPLSTVLIDQQLSERIDITTVSTSFSTLCRRYMPNQRSKTQT